jgi:hypothetical protein
MPQGNSGNPLQKKKKKGHAPAHQNTFAFRHNPKSKKTATILESPIDGVCRRCHDKLEWRKRYRKYKPLTKQPSKCNLCSQRNVRAAYHTICTSCAQSSSKALQVLEEWNQQQQQQQQTDPQSAPPVEQDGEEEEVGSLQQHGAPATRICAVCVQEPAMSEENDHCRGDQCWDTGQCEDPDARPLKLRELKTLERQRERAAIQSRSQRQPQQDEHEVDHSNNDDQHEHLVSQAMTEGLIIDDGFDSDDANDPFLQAVGGADKLLTGEAYQQKLLWELEQKQRT